VIPFRIVAHDPRNFKKYEKRWADNEGFDPKWAFSKSETEEDAFKHRLGQHPSHEMILASIPTLMPERIPKAGSLYMAEKQNGWVRENYYGGSHPKKERASADETDAVIVEDRVHCTLMEELFNFGSVGRNGRVESQTLLDGDIPASWDATYGSRVSLRSAY